MSVINTNMSGIIATNAIIRNDREQEQAMERLSTGLRINSAGDDAAGLAIGQRMEAEVSGLQMATRNANDAISMLETAEGATDEIHQLLQRMRELTVQSATGTYSDTDRRSLDLEFGQLMNEITRISLNTTWNTMGILDGMGGTAAAKVDSGLDAGAYTSDIMTSDYSIQLGKGANETMQLQLRSWNPANAVAVTRVMERLAGDGFAAIAAAGATTSNDMFLGNGAAFGDTVANQSHSAYGGAILWTGGDGGAEGGTDNANRALAQAADKRVDITTIANATFVLTQLDTAITAASNERVVYGAFINRLEHAGDNLTNVARYQEASRSQIEDADYAVETSELSRTTIIAQASTAMLAQANQSKQIVLALLE